MIRYLGVAFESICAQDSKLVSVSGTTCTAFILLVTVDLFYCYLLLFLHQTNDLGIFFKVVTSISVLDLFFQDFLYKYQHIGGLTMAPIFLIFHRQHIKIVILYFVYILFSINEDKHIHMCISFQHGNAYYPNTL